jgi:hypothetical protein
MKFSFWTNVLLQKFDCVFVLAIRGLLHMTKNFIFCVVWFFLFNHWYRIFWKKFPLKKSWCCRKHVLVFEIVSLKGLNKFWSNHSFPIECWVKDLFTIMEKVLISIVEVWHLKLNFWEIDFWVKPLEKVKFDRYNG